MVGTRASNQAKDSDSLPDPQVLAEVDDWVLPDDLDSEDEDDGIVIRAANSQVIAKESTNEINNQDVLQDHSVNTDRSFVQEMNNSIYKDKTFLGSADQTRMLRQFDGNSKEYQNDKDKTVAELIYLHYRNRY